MKLSQFWQQLMLRLALIGAVLALCFMWGGLVAPVSAASTALVRIIHASPRTGSVNFMVHGTTASAPAVSLRPTSLNFGHQQVNTTSAVRTITLTNSGDAALTIESISRSGPNRGDFAQSNTCPSSSSTLAAGASCTINVTFTPTATGSRSANVTITDNASGSPQSVALSGTGVPGAPGTGSDPHAQPPAGNTQQGPLGWLALIGAVVAAAGIGTALISGRLRRSRPR